MSDFVGTSPFLRKSIWVDMAVMHFHIVQTVLLMGIFLRIQGVTGNNVTPIQNCPWGAR